MIAKNKFANRPAGYKQKFNLFIAMCQQAKCDDVVRLVAHVPRVVVAVRIAILNKADHRLDVTERGASTLLRRRAIVANPRTNQALGSTEFPGYRRTQEPDSLIVSLVLQVGPPLGQVPALPL